MTTPRNVILITSDQHNPRVLGAAGDQLAHTPNLDHLAARGTRFSHAYCASPICVPSRSAIATGRHPHQIGSTDNAAPYVGHEAPSWGHHALAAGRAVTTIGKLHYRAEGDPSGFPDQRIPLHVLDGIGDLRGILRQDEAVNYASREQVLGARAGESDYTQYDRAVAARAAQWLQTEAATRQPGWALHVSLVTPHLPLIAPQEFLDLFPPERMPLPVNSRPEQWTQHPALAHLRRQNAHDEPFTDDEVRQAVAAYYALVAFMDSQVGTVLDTLEQTGLAESTCVVYTTDHGDNLGAHGIWWKSSMLERSVGVPLIIAGGETPAGATCSTPAAGVDIMPTLLDAIDVDVPSGLPGESLWQLAAKPDHERIVFSEYHAAYSKRAVYMVTDGRWKYVHYVGEQPQLFDLSTDPDECHDLAAKSEYAELRAEMLAELNRVLDPESVDCRVRDRQRRLVDSHGGVEHVLHDSPHIPFSPTPKLHASDAPRPLSTRPG